MDDETQKVILQDVSDNTSESVSNKACVHIEGTDALVVKNDGSSAVQVDSTVPHIGTIKTDQGDLVQDNGRKDDQGDALQDNAQNDKQDDMAQDNAQNDGLEDVVQAVNKENVLLSDDFPSTSSGLIELMVEIAKAVGVCHTFLRDEEIFKLFEEKDHFDVLAIDKAICDGLISGANNFTTYNNVFLGHLLLLIYTRGKYAWDVWPDIDFNKSRYEIFDENTALTLNRIKTLLDVAGFENFRIAELLVRIVVCGQKIYKPTLWEKTLTAEWEGLSVTPRISCVRRFAGWSGSSISVIGADHDTCDDFSIIADISDGKNKEFAAVSADGVSACLNSRFGSEAIAQAVIDVATAEYRRLHSWRESKIIKRQISKDKDNVALRFSKSIFDRWQSILKQRFGESVNVRDFGTTLLFTIKINNLIVCGVLGDGVFLVKTVGGLLLRLTDGYSSIKENGAPYNVSLLGDNPSLLKMFFFSAKDVKTILIGSDGVDYLLYGIKKVSECPEEVSVTGKKDMDKILAENANVETDGMFLMENINAVNVLDELSGLTFNDVEGKNVPKTLEYYVHRFSRVNVTGGGGGDDCSLVYLRNICKMR